jgi:hypothetical protein
MTGRIYDVIPQNGDFNVRNLVFETKSVIKMQRRYRAQYGKAPPSDNAIRRWVKQFQETGSVAAAVINNYTSDAAEHLEGN